MSLKINGLKRLEANDYETIIIRESNGRFQVDVKAKTKLLTKSSKGTLSLFFEQMSDEEKIMLIVENFLRNAKINYVGDYQYIPYYDGRFSVISGTRELDIKVFNPKLDTIPKMVMNKYIDDRKEFITANNNIEKYELLLGRNESSYEIAEINHKNYIKLNLLYRNGKLANFEKTFLQELVKDKLDGIGEPARIINPSMYFEEAENMIQLGKYLVCGNFSMRLYDDKLISPIEEVMNKYNEERKNAKKKQLKMEGF